MKVEEPIGEYYSQSYIRNMRRRIIKSIREEENIDVLNNICSYKMKRMRKSIFPEKKEENYSIV